MVFDLRTIFSILFIDLSFYILFSNRGGAYGDAGLLKLAKSVLLLYLEMNLDDIFIVYLQF